MNTLNIVLKIITVLGIAGLTYTGASATDIGVLIPVGAGIGTGVSFILSLVLKKKK